MDNKAYLVRSETLSGFDELVRAFGADPADFYERMGLSEKLMCDPDYLVPYASICSLLDLAARELQQEELGLSLGSRLRTFPIGMLWPLIAHCPNVQTGLEAGIEYYHLHSQGLSWTLTVEDDRAVLAREDLISGDIPTFQYAVMNICTCFSLMKALCGSTWAPSAISFIHTKPVNTKNYDRYFGVRTQFNHEFSGITFPAADLRGDIKGRSAYLSRQLSEQVRKMEARQEPGDELMHKLKRLIMHGLHSTTCNQGTIAHALSMHPKALQRTLHSRGLTFRELRAEVRLDMAERYLAHSEISLTAIADILGFSDLSNFSHAFKSRHGTSPRAWRLRSKSGC